MSLPRFSYCLTDNGERRVTGNNGKGEFYLQQTPKYRGYTEKIFRALYGSEPKTIAEITQKIKPFYPGVRECDLRRSVNGVITFNVHAGYIGRILL